MSESYLLERIKQIHRIAADHAERQKEMDLEFPGVLMAAGELFGAMQVIEIIARNTIEAEEST